MTRDLSPGPVLVRVRAWRAGEADPHAGFSATFSGPPGHALRSAMARARSAFAPGDRVRLTADALEPEPAPVPARHPGRVTRMLLRVRRAQRDYPGPDPVRVALEARLTARLLWNRAKRIESNDLNGACYVLDSYDAQREEMRYSRMRAWGHLADADAIARREAFIDSDDGYGEDRP